MFEIIFAVFVIFFFCLGLGDFLHILRLLILSSKQEGQNILVSFLKEKTSIKQTRKIIEKYRWYGTAYADKIVFVYDNLSVKTIGAISGITGKEQNVFYCNKQEFIHLISRLNEEENEQSGTVRES